MLASLILQLGDDYGRPVWEVHASQIVITSVEGTAAMRLSGVVIFRALHRDGLRVRQGPLMLCGMPNDVDHVRLGTNTIFKAGQ